MFFRQIALSSKPIIFGLQHPDVPAIVLSPDWRGGFPLPMDRISAHSQPISTPVVEGDIQAENWEAASHKEN
jgi:hypothetical protein